MSQCRKTMSGVFLVLAICSMFGAASDFAPLPLIVALFVAMIVFFVLAWVVFPGSPYHYLVSIGALESNQLTDENLDHEPPEPSNVRHLRDGSR